jgi:hypothetical protein
LVGSILGWSLMKGKSNSGRSFKSKTYTITTPIVIAHVTFSFHPLFFSGLPISRQIFSVRVCLIFSVCNTLCCITLLVFMNNLITCEATIQCNRWRFATRIEDNFSFCYKVYHQHSIGIIFVFAYPANLSISILKC